MTADSQVARDAICGHVLFLGVASATADISSASRLRAGRDGV